MRRWLRLAPFVLVLASSVSLLSPRAGDGVPLYAGRHGLPCVTCHFDPNGGGPRNEFGFSFAKNRHALVPEPESPWGDLVLTNRVGETMPIYLGLNHRFMMLTNRRVDARNIERLGFFNMENALHTAFQPHRQLTLVYTADAFAAGPASSMISRDAFGLVGGLPGNGWIRAGRFRTPFGLRMDDHTVATRGGFGDFGTGGRILPYDPRRPDMGLEFGAGYGGWSGSAAYTNGQSSVFSPNAFAEAKTARAVYSHAVYQGGVSLYDDFVKLGSRPVGRHTRWGYHAMKHAGPLTFLGEAVAGTDKTLPTGQSRNRLAWFAEIDYAPWRWLNVRARYDRSELDRRTDWDSYRRATHSRYSLEGEIVPVPLAELRWTLRYLDARHPEVSDERQAYLQAHFSY